MPDLDEVTTKRLTLLGFLRVLALNDICHIFFGRHTEEEREGLLADLKDNTNGMLLVADALGLGLDAQSFFAGDPTLEKLNRFVSFLMDITMTGDEVAGSVAKLYGTRGRYSFCLSQELSLARLLTSVFRVPAVHAVSDSERPKWAEEKRRASTMIKEIGAVLVDHFDLTKLAHGNELAERIRRAGEQMSTKRFTAHSASRIHSETELLLNSVIPYFGEISERIARYRGLSATLQRCPAGNANWPEYEDLGTQVLRFLFIPPFRDIHTQVRNQDGSERRDATLANHQYEGFWGRIREEFDSRHVVVEFKNGRTAGDQLWIDQLRIYLSKPTIGRFGLLFVRRPPSESLLRARRDAYEQSRILILIFDDQKIRELMRNRAYLGTADVMLEREKAQFEVTY